MKARTHPGHFTMVRDDDIEKYGLRAGIVLGLIRRRCDAPDGICWEGVRGMARRLRIHRNTICKIIDQLEESGEIILSPSATKRWSGSRDIRLAHPVTIDEALEDIEIRNLAQSKAQVLAQSEAQVLAQSKAQEETREETTVRDKVVVPQKYHDYARDMGAKHPEQYALKCFQGGVLDKGKTPTEGKDHLASARAFGLLD